MFEFGVQLDFLREFNLASKLFEIASKVYGKLDF